MKTIRIGLPALAIGITGLLILIVWVPTGLPGTGKGFALRTIETTNGWGYEISLHGRVIIYQESIPGQAGNAGFKCTEAAEKAGELVLRKLEKNRLPALSEEEIRKVCNLDEMVVRRKKCDSIRY